MFVGTTDLSYAYIAQLIRTGHFASGMLNYIAGGALGLETSMKGGTPVAFLGLFFHYFIAFSFTLFFFWIFPRVKFLAFNKYFIGMLYGVFVNLAMKVILLLTPLPPGGFDLGRSLVDWYIFGGIFGIPIAWNAYRYYRVPKDDLFENQ